MVGKDIENFEKRMNIYVYTTLVTVSVTIAVTVFKFLFGWGFNPAEALLYGVLFWIVFLLTTKFILNRVKEKEY